MPPNLRKPSPNLAKPSESGTFNAQKKPTETTNPLKNLNLTGERELGTAGGIKATARATIGVDGLIGQQGVQVEIDASNRTAGVNAGIGSTKGKLGVNIGAKVGYDENGKISVKGAEAGINIAGTGASASIDEDEGIKGSVSIAGAKVEVGILPNGKKTVSICYGVPGGEICTIFEPEPEPDPNAPSLPVSPDTPIDPPPPAPDSQDCGSFKYQLCALAIMAESYSGLGNYRFNEAQAITEDYAKEYEKEWLTNSRTILDNVRGSENYTIKNKTETRDKTYKTSNFIKDDGNSGLPSPISFSPGFNENRFVTVSVMERIIKHVCIPTDSPNQVVKISDDDFTATNHTGCADLGGWGTALIKKTVVLTSVDFPPCPPGSPPPTPTPPRPRPVPRLPNYPQNFKPTMNDCCEMVEEIYMYLGIGKLKKNKFPVANAFLVPGGTGNSDCVDYYTITQALFRMLANGLILNPKSQPLGSNWQNVNATAWAADMYAMMAESMSDGNSSQRFEVAAIMQLVQIMSTVAENGRKIECAIDAIGLEPLPTPEDLPVCFTIYEGHKGFGKKEPKKINTSELKTDNDVENALGNMLKPSKIPITAWRFKPGQISINEALRNNG